MDSRPATMALLAKGERFAVISTYTDNRGNRVSTLTLCTMADAPGALPTDADFARFGPQEHRDTMTPEQAIELARSWLDGKGLIGGGL